MSGRIQELFGKKRNILSLYVMAGFPSLNDTVPLCVACEQAGVDLLEIGMPFSDPVADGPTIQRCSDRALKQGMSIDLLFQQLETVRQQVSLPLVLMGYINPVLQYGIEKFCERAAALGIDGVILPDLPLEEYLHSYQPLFAKHDLANIFLVTSRTDEERIRLIDAHSKGFIYLVSSDATTGGDLSLSPETREYFQRVGAMKLQNPTVVGFGISTRESFELACQSANGAIIASAFLRWLEERGSGAESVATFVEKIRGVRQV